MNSSILLAGMQLKTEENYAPLEEDVLISLLPSYTPPKIFLVGDKLPCHGEKIKIRPIESILKKIKRDMWIEGLYARKKDLDKIRRYQNPDHSYKTNFDETKFFSWIKSIEENTALCDMENKNLGKGVFVPPRKILIAGTFIPSSGIIKLNPTKEELETKIHCSALQDLNSPERKIVGFIDPDKQGGILDFINHAPSVEELSNFRFKNSFDINTVATANLKSTIKFYNGYAIMGLEACNDIQGGKYGKQLLWSYALPDEYLANPDKHQTLLLFDNRTQHNGEIIDSSNYSLREIDIFIDTGELLIRKVTTLTRWEIMESSPNLLLVISTEDPFSLTQSEPIQSPISYGLLQNYLLKNPDADRVIFKIPIFKIEKLCQSKENWVKNASNY